MQAQQRNTRKQHTRQADTMSTTANTSEHGYITAYSAGGGERQHVVARTGTEWNDFAGSALCGTSPRGRWGTGSSAVRWSADSRDTVYPTVAEAAAAARFVCARCAAKAAKMVAVEPVAAPAEDEPAPITGDPATWTEGNGHTWESPCVATVEGEFHYTRVSDGYCISCEYYGRDATDTRAIELAVMSAPGSVRVDTGRTLPANGVDGDAVATVTSYFQGGPGRGECVDSVIVTVAGGHSHPARVSAAHDAMERLQGRVSGNITAGQYQTLARGSRDTLFVFGTWSN